MERVQDLHSAARHLQQAAEAMSRAFYHLQLASSILTPVQEPCQSVYDGRYEYGYRDPYDETPYNSQSEPSPDIE